MSTSPPLSARRSPERLQEYAALIEGYPPHLHLAIDDWLDNEAGVNREEEDTVRALLREFGVWRRRPFPESFRPRSENMAAQVLTTMKTDDEFARKCRWRSPVVFRANPPCAAHVV
jgi:hypothetical protein